MDQKSTRPVLRGASLASQVHDRLAEMLLAGELAPDDRLSMRDLADRLGVSVMPVRDAVARLIAQEALVVLPNRAVAVPLLNRGAFRDLTEVRIHNERWAAAMAADRVSPSALADIRRLADEFAEALSLAESRPSVGINKALHFAVYDAAASPVLAGVIRSLWLKAGPILNLDLEEPTRRRRSAESRIHHAALVSGLAGRDPAAAAAAIEADIRSAAEFILSRDILPS